MKELTTLGRKLGGRLSALLLFVGLTHAAAPQAALIELQPASTAVGNGEVLSIDLIVGGLGNFSPDSLGAFDISVGFDASVFSFAGYSLGNFLGDPGLVEALDVSAGDLGGAVNVAEVSLLSAIALDTLQPDSFLLATLNFDVVDIGESQVTVLSILSAPLLADTSGLRIGVTEVGQAEVEGRSPIPLPGTVPLLISALLGWRTMRKIQTVTK